MSLFRTAVSKILTLLLHTLLHCMTDVLLYETHHLLTMLFLVQSIQAVAVLSCLWKQGLLHILASQEVLSKQRVNCEAQVWL